MMRGTYCLRCSLCHSSVSLREAMSKKIKLYAWSTKSDRRSKVRISRRVEIEGDGWGCPQDGNLRLWAWAGMGACTGSWGARAQMRQWSEHNCFAMTQILWPSLKSLSVIMFWPNETDHILPSSSGPLIWVVCPRKSSFVQTRCAIGSQINCACRVLFPYSLFILCKVCSKLLNIDIMGRS